MNHDINLMPKKSKASMEMFFISSAVLIIIFLGLGYLSFFKLIEKSNLEENIRNMEDELLSMAGVEERYNELTEEWEYLNRIDMTFRQIKDGKLMITGVFDEIEQCMSENITITTLSISNRSININGTSSNNKEIAQFIVNLRNLDSVSDVQFNNSSNGEDEYTFSMVVTLQLNKSKKSNETNETDKSNEANNGGQ